MSTTIIPHEMTSRRQWITWRDDNGRKIPNGRSNTPSDWKAFDEVSVFDNIAFVFSADDPLTGIDLDGCIVDRQYTEWVLPILERFQGVAYGEISPSGNGLKLTTHARKPQGSRCTHKVGDGKQQIECYDNARFWTVTQNVVQGFQVIGDGQAAVDWLCTTYLSNNPKHETPQRDAPSYTSSERLIERARAYAAKATPATNGSRNLSAFSLAGNLFALDEAGYRLAETEVLEIVRGWNDRNPEPLDDNELRRTVRSALTNGTPRSTKTSSYEGPASPPWEREQATSEAKKTFQGIRPVSIGDLIDEAVQAEIAKRKPGSTAPAAKNIEPRDRYKPFPVHVLPSPLDALVEEAAVAIGCDEAFVALPLLSTVAASIGNTCRLVVKKGWNVPPAIWTMIVGESGTAKSPAFKIAKAPLQRHQKLMLDDFARLMEIYGQEVEQYELVCKELKRSKRLEPPPDKPQCPILQRVVVSDTTVEALAPILSQNPRGLLLQRDELNGWLGSFNQYKSAKGADESAWLSMFDGESITVDRKGEGTVPTYVESALVSITGGIQPAVLAASMTREHRTSGMASRFLIASPPRRCQTWTDEEVSEETLLMIDGLFIKLLAIDFADIETATPHFVGLSCEAKQVFRDFFNEHHQEQTDLTGDSAAAWSKLLGYVPRIALVFHIVKQLSHGGEITTPVDSRTVDQAIQLVTWFKQEAARLYASIDDTDDQRELRELAAWIDRKHGGECTPSDLVRGIKSIKTVEQAEEQAKLLVRAGLAAWSLVETPSGTGPQKRVLRTV